MDYSIGSKASLLFWNSNCLLILLGLHTGSHSCCCSVAKSCLTPWDPTDCSTPGFPIPHHLLELAQMHVHWVTEAIQPSHPVIPFSSCLQSFPASGSFSVSQIFESEGQSTRASVSASVLPMNIQCWFPLELAGFIFLLCKGLSEVFSSTIVWKRWFFDAQPSLWFNFYFCTWLLEKPHLWLYGPLSAKWCLCLLIYYISHSFPSKEQVSFNFMAVVTNHSDFGAQENKVCHCFRRARPHPRLRPAPAIYLPWNYGTGSHDLSFLNVEF